VILVEQCTAETNYPPVLTVQLTVLCVNRSRSSRLLLRISFPLVTDEGLYTARASLSELLAEKTIQLIVNGTPES